MGAMDQQGKMQSGIEELTINGRTGKVESTKLEKFYYLLPQYNIS